MKIIFDENGDGKIVSIEITVEELGAFKNAPALYKELKRILAEIKE